METGPDGKLRVGLNFCSFQASLEQFDVVVNDWMLNHEFPTAGAGSDALLDPNAQLTVMEKLGFYFVPPHHPEGLAAAVFTAPAEHGKPTTGKLVVSKRVVDPTDPSRRFERQGFVFQVIDTSNGQPVGDQFPTDSTGPRHLPGGADDRAEFHLA
jgi:hypothetical protein